MTKDFQHKLTAILSADVVGYSRLMGDDEGATVKTLETYKGVMSSLIKQHRGRVVDSPGDNLLSEFVSVRDAVRCAVEIQKVITIRNSEFPENRWMQFRIGINLGDVITEGNRIYGDGVNVAARIESLADAGGICLSRSAYDQVKGKIDIKYDYLGEHEVKNIDEPVRVYKVLMDSTKVYVLKKDESKETSPIEKTPQFLKERPSIAVLPFSNLSSDAEQEYFSDGLTEELINKLSQLKDLQVTARTSSFFFKGKNVDMRTIGKTLSVAYLLEGSVRKSGSQLRITAQLIKAVDGYHLWSKTYDRELKDVFTIQDDIATAVTTALSITLGVGQFRRLGMTHNIEAYDEYLRAMSNFYKLTPDSLLAAIDQFKWALDIDPDFGLCWVRLSTVYEFGISFLPPGQTVDFEARAAEALKRAQAIAPDMSEVMMMTALVHQRSGNWIEADRILKQILDEQGNTNPDAHSHYGRMLLFAGRCSDALSYLQRAKRLNPLDPSESGILSVALSNLGRKEDALEEARRSRTLEGFELSYVLTEWLVALENNDKPRAANIITKYHNLEGDHPDATMLRLAELLLIEDTEAALSKLKELSKGSHISPFTRRALAHVASALGDAEWAFESILEKGEI